jgi:flagellar motility protein MotE (MotC chaperone)
MRLRLFPVLIATALIALTVRVGDLWTGLGTIAWAQTAAQSGQGAGSADAASGDPTPPEVEGARIMSLPSDPFALSDEEIDLLQSLAERRKELDLRAHQLEQREVLLLAVERRIDEKVEGLKALQRSIEGETESQYKSLVKIYENMKPKDAARIFEELDMAILLPVTERMKERKLAAILAKMNTTNAMSLTIQLAQRRNVQSGQQAQQPDQAPAALPGNGLNS